MRWKANCDLRSKKIDNADLIMQKVYKRLMRIAWAKYKRGFDQLVQEEKFEKRLDEVKLRLDFKTKKRIYAAIKGFSSRHMNARNFLRNLLKRLDKHNKNTAFRTWKDYGVMEEQQNLNEIQNAQVGNMADL